MRKFSFKGLKVHFPPSSLSLLKGYLFSIIFIFDHIFAYHISRPLITNFSTNIKLTVIIVNWEIYWLSTYLEFSCSRLRNLFSFAQKMNASSCFANFAQSAGLFFTPIAYSSSSESSSTTWKTSFLQWGDETGKKKQLRNWFPKLLLDGISVENLKSTQDTVALYTLNNLQINLFEG